jgi:hypothetical protein
MLYELLGEHYRAVAGQSIPPRLSQGGPEMIFSTLLNFDRPNFERWLRATFEDRHSPPAERLEFAQKLDQVDPGYLRSAQAGRSFDEILGELDLTRNYTSLSQEFVKNHLKDRLLIKLRNSKSAVINIATLAYILFGYDLFRNRINGNLDEFCELVTELSKRGNISPKSFEVHNGIIFERDSAIRARMQQEVGVLTGAASQGDEMAEEYRSRLLECISALGKTPVGGVIED